MPRVDVRVGLRRVCALLARGDAVDALAQGRGLLDALARRPQQGAEQLALSLVPLVTPDDVVPCDKLRGSLPARVCVMRQRISDVQQTQDRHRGTASDYPHCITARCEQGRHRRDVLDPNHEPWVGSGPGQRFQRCASRSNKREREGEAARARLRAVGLLDEVSTVDGPAPAVETGDEDIP